MSIGKELLFFFSTLGAFNGLILGFYLLAFKKPASPASRFLGLLLLALSLRIAKVTLIYFYPDLPRIYLQIGLSACFMIGPSLYYFTKAALGQYQQMPAAWKYIYGVWIALIATFGIILPYQSHPWDWNHYIVHLIYLQWAVYVLLTSWLLRELVARALSPTEKLLPGERPILSIYVANAVIFITYLIVFFGSSGIVYISGALFFSLLLYLNIPLFVNRRKSDTTFLGNEVTERYANKKFTEEQALTLTQKLQKTITDQELYKDPDLKLNDLAKMLNISGHQLSQLLNDNLGKSFAVYINEYRIERACKLISNDKAIKLEEIGYAVGFNSKSTFYTAFKKHKGTTPAHYKAGSDL
jgi:AraC-like DNA-binding protein